MVKTEAEMRAKLLSHLERAKNELRRGKKIGQTMFVISRGGSTAYALNPDIDEAEQRRAIEALVKAHQAFMLIHVADAWFAATESMEESVETAANGPSPSERPDREEAVYVIGTHVTLGARSLMQRYGRDQRNRAVFDKEAPAFTEAIALNPFLQWNIWDILAPSHLKS